MSKFQFSTMKETEVTCTLFTMIEGKLHEYQINAIQI